MEGLRLIQMGGKRVALGLSHLRPKRVRYGFVRRGGGITDHSDGPEKGGAWLELFADQACPIPYEFQRTESPLEGEFMHHFVPVFLQGILSNSTKKVSKSISFDVF